MNFWLQRVCYSYIVIVYHLHQSYIHAYGVIKAVYYILYMYADGVPLTTERYYLVGNSGTHSVSQNYSETSNGVTILSIQKFITISYWGGSVNQRTFVTTIEMLYLCYTVSIQINVRVRMSLISVDYYRSWGVRDSFSRRSLCTP